MTDTNTANTMTLDKALTVFGYKDVVPSFQRDKLLSSISNRIDDIEEARAMITAAIGASTLMHYNARSYKHAFEVLAATQEKEEYTLPSDQLVLPILYLASHAVECYLKAFLIVKGQSEDFIKKNYGHKLPKLYLQCEEKGIYNITPWVDAEDYQIDAVQKSLLEFKIHLDDAVNTLHPFHSGLFPNRYLKTIQDGYLSTFLKLKTDIKKIDELFMYLLGNPVVGWRLAALKRGQIWRSTIPGSTENAREIVNCDLANLVIFIQRHPAGTVLSTSQRQENFSEWETWRTNHKAEPIELDKMFRGPGSEL